MTTEALHRINALSLTLAAIGIMAVGLRHGDVATVLVSLAAGWVAMLCAELFPLLARHEAARRARVDRSLRRALARHRVDVHRAIAIRAHRQATAARSSAAPADVST